MHKSIELPSTCSTLQGTPGWEGLGFKNASFVEEASGDWRACQGASRTEESHSGWPGRVILSRASVFLLGSKFLGNAHMRELELDSSHAFAWDAC